VLEDAERPITAWNERQARRMPLLLAPAIGAALAELRVPVGMLPGLPHDAIDQPARGRRYSDAAVTSLIPVLPDHPNSGQSRWCKHMLVFTGELTSQCAV
jgi:hypothetical protein